MIDYVQRFTGVAGARIDDISELSWPPTAAGTRRLRPPPPGSGATARLAAGPTAGAGGWADGAPGGVLARPRAAQHVARRRHRGVGARPLLSGRPGPARLPAGR